MQVSSVLDGGQSKPPSERVSPDAESRMFPAPRVDDGGTNDANPFGAGSALGSGPVPEPEQPVSAALISAAAKREPARCWKFMGPSPRSGRLEREGIDTGARLDPLEEVV